jgi:hypothetical protein
MFYHHCLLTLFTICHYEVAGKAGGLKVTGINQPLGCADDAIC